MSTVIDLTQHLVACPSITPNDAGCQDILAKRLTKSNFNIEHLPFGEVKNIWARYGNSGPLLVFVGHTDVVPTGPLEQWTSAPFDPQIRDGLLYGRGAADMKGSIAAMIIACENFIKEFSDFKGSIAFLITSDEEGVSIDGTAKVVEVLKQRKEKVDWCIVGEPSSDQTLGDIIKIGRRGSLSGKLIIYGKQGHIAYPQLADNPIHKALFALNELVMTQWDLGNEFFQPTSLQISNIHSGTGAGNVIPGEIIIDFNLRYSPLITAEFIQQKFNEVLAKYNLHHSLQWHHSGKPFLTQKGQLVAACTDAIKLITGTTPQLSTIGGTSDGRFMAELGCQIAEVGPRNNTIHQINECVSVAELNQLVDIYQCILKLLFIH
jgi:succinyl-diaminopimelate desuccinylase